MESDAALKDGSSIHIRPIDGGRPPPGPNVQQLQSSDNLSALSAPVTELTPAMARYLSSVDQCNRVALIAVMDIEPIGVVRYEPTGDPIRSNWDFSSWTIGRIAASDKLCSAKSSVRRKGTAFTGSVPTCWARIAACCIWWRPRAKSTIRRSRPARSRSLLLPWRAHSCTMPLSFSKSAAPASVVGRTPVRVLVPARVLNLRFSPTKSARLHEAGRRGRRPRTRGSAPPVKAECLVLGKLNTMWRVLLVKVAPPPGTLRLEVEVWRTNARYRSKNKRRLSYRHIPAKAFAAQSATSGLGPFTLQRRTPRPQDVQIEILYCGVCHSDLHQVRDEWRASCRPYIPACRATKLSAAW